MNNMITFKDSDLREAIKRKFADTPTYQQTTKRDNRRNN